MEYKDNEKKIHAFNAVISWFQFKEYGYELIY